MAKNRECFGWSLGSLNSLLENPAKMCSSLALARLNQSKTFHEFANGTTTTIMGRFGNDWIGFEQGQNN